MNDLPPGWTETTVGSIAASLIDGPFGSKLKSEHYQSSGVRVIRLQNIADGRFDDADKAYISPAHAKTLNRHEAQPGDVLIAALGDILPRVCLVPPHIDRAIVKADCFRLRPHTGISANYLAYILSAPQMRKRASIEIAGIGRPRLNLRKVSALAIPVPPRTEQDRIVAAIEEQFSQLDVGVAALDRVQSNLKRMRAAVLVQAFRHLEKTVNPVPGGVLFTFVTSGSRGWAEYYSSDGPAFLRIGNVPRTGIDLNAIQVQRVTPPANAEGRRTRVRSGDILVSITADLGRVAVVPQTLGEAYINQHLALARPIDGAVPRYLAWYLASPFGLRQWDSLRRGATKIGLGLDDIRSVRIPIPSSEVQQSTVDGIESAWERLRWLERCLIDCKREAHRLRSSMLATAFSGKLVAQDLTDEPASVLLQRIAVERGSSDGQGPVRSRDAREREEVTA
jgi:type I restriction enzyme, S subunit